MAIKTRQTTATGVTNNNAPLTNAELDNNFVELQQNKVDASGDTLTGNLAFGDNNKVMLGSGNDLQFLHNGANSYVDNFTGNLYINNYSDDRTIQLTGDDGTGAVAAYLLVDGANGTVNLNHYGSQKLITSSTGIDVTGEVKADKFTNDEALPDIRPSLLLDFANQKALDPRIDFRRGSIATYWDGETVTKAEENLVTSSEELSTTMSVVGATWSTDATTAPDGTTTADLLTESSGNESHRFYRINGTYFAGLLTGQRCTLSVYAKPNGKDIIQLNYYSGGGGGGGNTEHGQNFDITNGTIETSYGIVEGTSTINDVGNGWYRCSMTFDVPMSTTTSGTSPNVGVWLCESATDRTDRNHQGDGTSGAYFWGMQLERRGEVTTYTTAGSSAVVKYQPVLQTAAVDEARFDHNPATGESKGLLIEESVTNLNNNSTTYSGWSTSNIYGYTNAGLAPDGTVSADLLTINSTTDSIYRFVDYTTSTGYYTFSLFAKDGGGVGSGYALVRIGEETVPAKRYGIIVDLSDGTVTDEVSGNSPSGTSYQIDDVGNGWYRIALTMNKGSSLAFRVAISPYGNSTFTSGAGTVLTPVAAGGTLRNGVLFWGTQVEKSSYPTSYIPTSGGQATRATEETQIQGSNFTDWYNFDEGTLYYEASLAKVSELSENNISDGSNNNRILWALRSSAARAPYLQRYGGAVAEVYNNTGLADNVTSALAIALKDGDIASSLDGGTVATSTADIPKDVDRLQLAMLAVGDSRNSQYIKKFAYYPKRLSNATLQAMTED